MVFTSVKTMKSTCLIIALLLSLKVTEINCHGGDEEDSTLDHGDLHSKGLILVKIWCLIILLVTTFAAGVSPYFYRWNESFLLLGTQFAGGVFLSTSLIHFLSDSNSSFEDLTRKPYPFAFMLACAGYLLTMLGDCMVSFVTTGGQREAKVQIEGQNTEENGSELGMGMGSNGEPLRTSSLADTMLLILALCFHSVFEGIAVGVAGNF